jgi:hypothetical protein
MVVRDMNLDIRATLDYIPDGDMLHAAQDINMTDGQPHHDCHIEQQGRFLEACICQPPQDSAAEEPRQSKTVELHLPYVFVASFHQVTNGDPQVRRGSRGMGCPQGIATVFTRQGILEPHSGATSVDISMSPLRLV